MASTEVSQPSFRPPSRSAPEPLGSADHVEQHALLRRHRLFEGRSWLELYVEQGHVVRGSLQGVHLVYPERELLPPKVRAFIDLGVDEFGGDLGKLGQARR